MNLLLFISVMALFCSGCVFSTGTRNTELPAPPLPPVQTRTLVSRAEPQSVLPPPQINPIGWSWYPGDYRLFVVVTTADPRLPLRQWENFTNTTATNFSVLPNEPQRFFTLYGSNPATGESAWCQ